MTKEQLEKLLIDKKNESEPNLEKFKKRKEDWVAKVNKLIDDLKLWIAPFMDKDLLSYESKTITLVEEDIGSYEAQSLVITLANLKNTIIIEPVGTFIVAAYGRVDITYDSLQTTPLYLLPPSTVKLEMKWKFTDSEETEQELPITDIEDSVWKMREDDVSDITFRDFNKEIFYEIISKTLRKE